MRVPQKDKRSYFIRERPMTTNINNSPEYACRTCSKQECGCKDTECQLPCHFYTEQAEQESETETIGVIMGGELVALVEEYQTGAWPIYASHVRTKDLTDDELRQVLDRNCGDGLMAIARAVIAADREKNK